jgi:cytochrome c556
MSRLFSRAGFSIAASALFGLSLVACGGSETSSGAGASEAAAEQVDANAEAQAIIEARQAGYKNLGKNFKAISDEIRGGAPDVAVVQASAAVVAETADKIGGWFPEGSSAASGVETDALDAIWQQPAEFSAAIEQLKTAAAGLTAAATSGDAAAIQAAFQTTGGACKNCHDTFRADDD